MNGRPYSETLALIDNAHLSPFFSGPEVALLEGVRDRLPNGYVDARLIMLPFFISSFGSRLCLGGVGGASRMNRLLWRSL
jgi:hypothetical protein